MSLPSTLSPAVRITGGLTRRSLMSALTAISTTSSPHRRPFGPPPRSAPAPTPWCELADQRIAAEDAQSREARIVGVGEVRWTAAGQARRPSGQIDLDQIGDVDPGNVGSTLFNPRNVRLENQKIQELGELGILRVLPEQDA